MKNHLMSLVVCLTCFWSSYSSADYLDDQVLKYCKAFMAKYLKEDILKNLEYKLGYRRNHWSLNHSKYDFGSSCIVTGQTEEYYIQILGWNIERNKPPHLIKDKYSNAKWHHRFARYIPVAAVEYNQNVLYVTDYEWVTYLAISKFTETKTYENFNQSEGVYQLK